MPLRDHAITRGPRVRAREHRCRLRAAAVRDATHRVALFVAAAFAFYSAQLCFLSLTLTALGKIDVAVHRVALAARYLHARSLVMRSHNWCCKAEYIRATYRGCWRRAAAPMRRMPRVWFQLLLAVAFLPLTLAADDAHGGATSRPPQFDGSRTSFIAWFMAFSGYVAWKLTDAADLLEGDEDMPIVPAIVFGAPAADRRGP